jgi:hypothetical protein
MKHVKRRDPDGKMRCIALAGDRPPAAVRAKRKPFKVEWVMLPRQWVEALRESTSAATYRLAMVVLFEAFKREAVGGEVVLSSKVTGMKGSTRRRAAEELVKLGLIKLERAGRSALRVSKINGRKFKRK